MKASQNLIVSLIATTKKSKKAITKAMPITVQRNPMLVVYLLVVFRWLCHFEVKNCCDDCGE